MSKHILEEINPRVLGARLQDSRRASGLTQQAVAEQLGIARTTLVAIEKGERRVASHELLTLANLYGRPVAEFVGRPVTEKSFIPQFRASWAKEIEGDAGLAEAAIRLQQFAQNYIELEAMCGMPLAKFYPPVYDTTGRVPEQAGEDIATAERNRLGLGDGPVNNLRERLETDIGLRIFYFPMPSEVSGVFAFTDELGGCIGINSKHPPERCNWSLIHEYGHFLTTRYQPDITFQMVTKRNSANERLADAITANFLMPASGLNRRFSEIHRMKGSVNVADICTLAHLYQVSFQAMVRRLEDLKRLPYGTWDRLLVEGFKPRQAQQLLGLQAHEAKIQPFPIRYLQLAVMAYHKEELSEGQLARILDTDRITARTIVEEMSNRILAEQDQDFGTLQVDLSTPLGGR